MVRAIGLVVALAGLVLLGSGCSISNSPDVSQPDANGKYLAVVNKTTMILGIIISNRNAIVECEIGGKCKELTVRVK